METNTTHDYGCPTQQKKILHPDSVFQNPPPPIIKPLCVLLETQGKQLGPAKQRVSARVETYNGKFFKALQ